MVGRRVAVDGAANVGGTTRVAVGARAAAVGVGFAAAAWVGMAMVGTTVGVSFSPQAVRIRTSRKSRAMRRGA
jgi:hypothetical protein